MNVELDGAIVAQANQVQGVECAMCHHQIWSRHRHDMRYCGCGQTFVDGGKHYLRYGSAGAPPTIVWIDTVDHRAPLRYPEPSNGGLSLCEARLFMNYTQSEVAVHLGVHSQCVSNWERGVTSIPRAHYEALIALLGISRLQLEYLEFERRIKNDYPHTGVVHMRRYIATEERD